MVIPQALTTLITQAGLYDQLAKIHDTYTFTNTSTVRFSQAIKGNVTGYLNSGLKMAANAQWKPFTQALGGATNILNLADNALQSFSGVSVVQPWFSRKFWEGTDPLVMDIQFSLVAIQNAKTEVWDKCMTLLAYCYPRPKGGIGDAVSAAVSKVGKGLSKIPGVGSLISDKANDLASASKTLNNIGELYVIPGPQLFYSGTKKDNDGDYVSVEIGNIITFAACYIHSVTIDFKPTLDPSGYPLAANVTVKVESMDANICDANGQFHPKKMGSNAGIINKAAEYLQS